MLSKYTIMAAGYPFRGHYEEEFQCATLWIALKKFREYKRQGYEIIDVHYRDIPEQLDCTWLGVE